MPKQNMCTCFRGSNWSALCIYIYPVRLTSIIFPHKVAWNVIFHLHHGVCRRLLSQTARPVCGGPADYGALPTKGSNQICISLIRPSSIFQFMCWLNDIELPFRLPLLLISARNVRIKVLRNVCTNFCFPACRGWQHWLPTSGYQKALHTLQKDLPCDSITAICCARFSHCLRQNPLANWKVWAIWWLWMYRSSSDPFLRIHIGGPWSIEYLWIPWDPATGQGRAPLWYSYVFISCFLSWGLRRPSGCGSWSSHPAGLARRAPTGRL